MKMKHYTDTRTNMTTGNSNKENKKYLIEEKNAWRTCPCTAEYCTHCQFTFTDIFIQKFRALDITKVVQSEIVNFHFPQLNYGEIKPNGGP